MTRDKTAEQMARKRQLKPGSRGGRERLRPARGQPGAVAMTGQGLGELAADVLVVLDEQDA